MYSRVKVWLSTAEVRVDYSGATAPEFHRLLRPEGLLLTGAGAAASTPVLPVLSVLDVMLEVTLTTTLIMLCAASTPLSRHGGFPGPDAPLDESGLRDAAACRLPDRFARHIHCSPARAAAETAAGMGLAAQVEPALADLDHGRWSGRSFADIETAFPGALLSWLGDPAQAAPGGEALAGAQLRVGNWLDQIAGASQALCAVTHAMTIRAALAHALGFPLSTTLAIDVAPLSRTVLSFNGKWRLQSLGQH